MIKRFMRILIFCLFVGIAPKAWAEEMVSCPLTYQPLNLPEKEPKGFESGKVLFDPPNRPSVFCRYDEDKYELFLHWQKPENPPQGKVPCRNGGRLSDGAPDQEPIVDEIKTYMSYIGFGLDVKQEDGKFYIEHAEKYSPAFNAGLEELKGAQILEVNGNSVEGMDPQEVYKMVVRDHNSEAKLGDILTLKIQLPESEETKDVELHAASFDPLVGSQIYVYSKTHSARVEVQIDPHQPITEGMKTYWVAQAKGLLKQAEPLAVECE